MGNRKALEPDQLLEKDVLCVYWKPGCTIENLGGKVNGVCLTEKLDDIRDNTLFIIFLNLEA